MSLPRPVIAGSTVMLTRRCTQRQFLLRPSPIANQILLYCLAVSASRYAIEIHAVCFMSNQQDIGGDITVERPKVFFREDGPMADTATFCLTKLPALAHLCDEAYIEQMGASIAQHEAELATKIVADRREFLGARAVRKQSPFDRPRSRAPRRKLSPRVAAPNKWARIEALVRLKDFIAAYREAWQAYREGRDPPIPFPYGTYWLRIHAAVPCAAPG